MLTCMTSNWITELREVLRGEVRDDLISRTVYSVDASIYEIPPLAVAIPRDIDDVRRAVEVAHRHDIPIIPRGAATGIAGGAIGRGLVLDLSQHLNNILEVNYDEEWIVCEPGVVQQQLNDYVAAKGYRLGPDTSTGNRATVGGMLSNNSAGARSLHYGKTVDHVLEVELLLASGELINFHALDDEQRKGRELLAGREGDIYRAVARLKRKYSDEIAARYPQIPRRVSGYNFDELIKEGPINLAKLICGAEGSLGLATKIKFRLCKAHKHTALCLLHYHDMGDALRRIADLLADTPLALEMIDGKILDAGRSVPMTRERIGWLQGHPQAALIAEFSGDSAEEAEARARECAARAEKTGTAYAIGIATENAEKADVWAVREAGLGLLMSKRSYSRAIGFLEDVAVDPNEMAPFIDKFQELLRRHGKEAGIYGHVGAGCVHIRPYIDLRDFEELATMRRMMEEASELLLEHKGSLSGEHGDGLVRSWLIRKMFGETLYSAFRSFKSAFDPKGLMNPGKVIATQGLHDNLRTDPSTRQVGLDTQFDFSRDGGIALAADMCNGNAMCRKRDGLMCPSFQAYGDEFHSTRARAQSLRAIFNGRISAEAFTSDELYKVMEYCLECKGCKTQCPSQVDMAKIKAEFLHHYQEKNGYSLRSRLLGQVAKTNKLLARFGPIVNWIHGSALGSGMRRMLGIAPNRPLPLFANQRFSTWLKKRENEPKPGAPKVVLMNDTFTEFNYPEIGISAVQVLEHLGYEVIVPKWRCCGRPLISKGFLKQAKLTASSLIELLWPYAVQGIPIIGLEPSCILTLKDDYPDLIIHDMTDEVIEHTQTIDSFFAQLARQGQLSLPHSPWKKAQVHTHCHQKALVGSEDTLATLRAIDGLEATEIPSGCCGLAGSFGYEQEHYIFSMKIGENSLFPAVREAGPDTAIVANGMSCRTQIMHGTGHSAMHLVQLLASCLDGQATADQ